MRAGRSHVLLVVLLAAVLLIVSRLSDDVASAADPAPNPIVLENQQSGTNSWQLGRPGFSISDDGTGQIKGYASPTSVNKGGQISFHVSVNPAQNFSADFYRMGWYGGQGGRLMTHLGPLAGTKQRTCTSNTTTGVIDCAWSPTFTFTVPNTWTSGVYLVVLTNAQNYQSYITFVVRDDTRKADLLYQQSVTTYQAYNNYPDDSKTGKSLYDFNSYGATVPATGNVRAAKVSFDRPYADGYGSGQFGGNSWNWERYYIGWLEQSGYDVTYSTNLDTHANGGRLLTFKGFLSVGHDEYWSRAMVDAATNARDAGVNLGFFGSNTAYWQVRFESSATGAANRVMVCYKSASLDPVKDSTATVLWRDPPVNRPEQRLVGVQYTAHLKNEGAGAIYVVRNSSNWVWEGTGFSDGSQVSGILGYESDRLMSEYAAPTNVSYTILSRSPVVDAAGRNDYANSSIYQAPSGAWVFATGTNHWSYGLGKPGVTDTRIQRATANVFNRFLGAVPTPQPPAAPSGLVASAASSSAIDLAWTDNASNETGYTVERSPNGTTGWVVLTSTLAAGTSSYRDSGLAASTAYSYRVKATNAAGSSAYSNIATATTSAQSGTLFTEGYPGADGSAWDSARWTTVAQSGSLDVLSGAGRMAFQNVSGASAQAIATMAREADTDTLMSFRYPSTGARGYFYVFSRASGNWVSGYPGTSYFLQLRNDDGTVQLWKSSAGTTTQLATVAGAASVTTAKQWVRFRVQGSSLSAKVWTDGTTEPSGWELTGTDSSITSSGVLQLKWWRPSSATGAREVILDDIQVTRASATTPQPPAAPSGLVASAASSSAIDLAWTDNASNETGYTVERSPNGTTGWVVLASTLAAGTSSYRDSGLAASTAYSYRVKATNAAGSSAYSNIATAITSAQSGTLFTEGYPGADGSAWNSARWTTVAQSGSLDVLSGAGRMAFQNVSGASAQAIATMAREADTDTLMSFRYPSTGARGYFYVFSRASENWVSGYPGTSYFLQLRNDDGTVQLWKSSAGTTTQLATVAGAASVTTAKQWVRFRVQGSSLSAKVWTDGTTEPSGWELTGTDSSITSSGVLQLKWWRPSSATGAREVILDDIQVTRLQ